MCRDVDTGGVLESFVRFGVLPGVMDRKTVIFTGFRVRQAGFVQNAIDPGPDSIRKAATKTADAAFTNGLPKHGQQPGPMFGCKLVALRLVRVHRRLARRGQISLVEGTAGLRHPFRDVSRQIGILRPVADLTSLDSVLVSRSAGHVRRCSRRVGQCLPRNGSITTPARARKSAARRSWRPIR